MFPRQINLLVLMELKKAINLADVVILATPPGFRPQIF